MRQAGVIAAAGLVALRDHVDRLADDHRRARRLADAVAARWPDLLDPARGAHQRGRVPPPARRSTSSPTSAAEGVLASTLGRQIVRLVTHLDVDDDGIDRACAALAAGARMTLDDQVPASALAVYAHPDDPEVSAGGTLAAWVLAGAEVHLVIVNRGRQGLHRPRHNPDALAAQRADEVAAAAKVLGLASVELLGIPDGESTNDVDLRRPAGGDRAPHPARRGGGARTRRRCSSATAT